MAAGLDYYMKKAPHLSRDDTILLHQTGRGDEDIFSIGDALGDERWREFIREEAASYGPVHSGRGSAR